MENDIISAVWPEWKKVKCINRGSFGVVYEAVRTDHGVESRAAIKVISIPQNDAELESLRSAGLSPDATKTYLQDVVNDFSNEIRIMESFKGNQNIVSVEDYKVIEKKGRIGWDIYIRMELLTPLQKYLSDKELSEEEVIKLGCDICSALERCAKRNVIHRDIKPDNIFINEFGDYKLGDFGIARTMESCTSGLSQKGTYNYMAPEVVKGRRYDASVDIYSLGIVLYWLLNKRRLPFVSTEKQLLSYHDFEIANRRRLDGGPLPAPCNASPAMTEVILKACDHDPGKRFASAEEMKNALKSVSEGTYYTERNPFEETIAVSHNPSYDDRLEPYSVYNRNQLQKRNRILVWICVFAAVFVVGGLMFSVIGRMSSKKDSSEKIEDGQTIETVADQSEGAEDDQNKGAEADQIANDDNNQSMETTPDHSVAEVPGNVSIPMNAMVYNGHSYSIFDNNCSSWEQARNYCRSRGGYLAVINDSKEDDFLFGYMKDVGLNQVFFGFSDAESEGNWKWVEEGTINGNSEYLNWGTNDEGEKEPNEAIESENYAQLDANMVTGKWNDCSFDQDTTAYICEWDYVVK